MADTLFGSTVQVLLEKAISLASQQIGFFVGFKKDLEKLKETLIMIQAFLEDADKKQVSESAVKLWLDKLERVAFDAEILLDDFNYEFLRRKVKVQNQMKRKLSLFFSLSNNPIAFRFKMVNKIQNINLELKSVSEEATNLGLLSQIAARDATALPLLSRFRKDRETVSVTVDPSFVGRHDDVSIIINHLTASSNNESVFILPLVGMGGIGKTTLARKVFNDLKIEKHFDKRMWVCVSDEFNVNRLFGLILESLQGHKLEVESMEAKVNQLKELLDGKKYLLVLDDVWNEETKLWNDFLGSLKGISSAKGNCILITTRKLQVIAPIMGTSSNYLLKQLSDDECWHILKAYAFGNKEVPVEFEDIGLDMAKKCQGLPLAASVLGGMLSNKGRDEWLKMRIHNFGNDENSVNKILKLSFDHLPYLSLKNCFAYCSIFPKDFEISKDQLIQLWAAEGFLTSNPRNNMDMEKVGDMYFSILLDSNLLQDVKKDEYGNVFSCKMHDLVHDLVQSIFKSKISRLEDSARVHDSESFRIRYLAMGTNGGEEISFPLNQSFRYITTLFLLENESINDIVISFLTYLRVLDLTSPDLENLPKSIGKLSHLRYLSVSSTKLRTLPNSVCQLYNLQTLRIGYCYSLLTFPNKFKNLVNLRHLDYFSVGNSSDNTPLEIGRLNCLQTLPFFNIGKEKGRRIGQLKSLENLSGRLNIRNLELVNGKEEAEFANLITKSNIYELKLLWGYNGDGRENVNEENQVLEGLQPHANLKGLTIQGFFGDKLPTWMGKIDNLVDLELMHCKYCKELPSLGHLSFLRSLKLTGLEGVTSIGLPFYGEGRARKKSFPALKHIILVEMPNLSEWTDVSIMMAFPVLEKLEIYYCPQLATTPNHFPSLKELIIYYVNDRSGIVKKICSGVSTLTNLSIEHVSEITELPYELFQKNLNLVTLTIDNCPDLRQFLDINSKYDHHHHPMGFDGSLETLTIRECDRLESISIPTTFSSALRKVTIFLCSLLVNLYIHKIFEESGSFSPLEELSVYECPNLTSFPLDSNLTPSLTSLRLPRCSKLATLPKGKFSSLIELEIGPFSKNTTDLHFFGDAFSDCVKQQKNISSSSSSSSLAFSSLRYLTLYGWPHWESLPDQLQHLSGLEFLELDGFGVKSLPDWFGKLSSLEILRLYNCEKLEYLPSHQSIRRLTKLQSLSILNCPLLKERCSPENCSCPNSEWSKISHLPYIDI